MLTLEKYEYKFEKENWKKEYIVMKLQYVAHRIVQYIGCPGFPVEINIKIGRSRRDTLYYYQRKKKTYEIRNVILLKCIVNTKVAITVTRNTSMIYLMLMKAFGPQSIAIRHHSSLVNEYRRNNNLMSIL